MILVAGGALFGLLQRGGARPAAASAADQPAQLARPAANGALTLADVETIAPGEGPPGWYGVSTLGLDGRLHLIARCPGGADWCGEVEGVAWSPDGERLAVGITSVGGANPYNGLHVIVPATGEDRTIRPCRPVERECDWMDIAWSPDGSRLAYVSNDEIALVNGDGTGHTVLRTDARSPSWSPDGQWLTFAQRTPGDSGVYVIRADGTDARLLVDHGSAPAWSPARATIAYRATCGIKLVTPDGVDATPGTRCGIGLPGNPVWSPDGRKIAVAGTTTYGTGPPTRGTYVMNADGTDLTRVTPKTQGVAMGRDPRPAWRPVPASR